jgi:16S rRNA processing protein RimM
LTLEVGRVRRAVGLKGQVVVRFFTDRPERRAPGTVFETSAGVRAVLVSASKRPDGDWTVVFEGATDKDAAEALRGPLFAEPIEDPDELWVHELVGAVVVDGDGIERGRVKEVHDGVAADLLVLDTGHLVPVNFVVAHEPGKVEVDVPEGLFDL